MKSLSNMTSTPFLVPKNDRFDTIVNDAFAFINNRWDLTPFIYNPRNKRSSHRIINFKSVPPLLLPIIKRHCYIELGRISPQSVCMRFSYALKPLLTFMEKYSFESFKHFDHECLAQYAEWLFETYITLPSQHKEALIKDHNGIEALKIRVRKQNTVYQMLLFTQQLLTNASLFKWKGAPALPTYINNPVHLLPSSPLKRKDRVIPKGIWSQLIQACRNESPYLFKSSDLAKRKMYRSGQAKGLLALNFAKYILLIQALTGLRISEVCSLQHNCTYSDEKGRKWLRISITKTSKEPFQTSIRINEEIDAAITEVAKLGIDYRQRSGMNYLFFQVELKRHNQIHPFSAGMWNQCYLRPFLKRNNINDANGEIYTMTSHDLRHTFASMLVNDYNVPLGVLTRHYSHLSMEMTLHYVQLSKTKLFQASIKGFTNAKKILSMGDSGEQFITLLNNASAVSSFEETIQKLSNAFSVNPLPFGICLYDYRRGHCPNLGVHSCWEAGCKEFLTNDTFLDVFEREASLLKEHIQRDCLLNQMAEVKKKKYRLEKITKIIGEIS